MNEKLNMYLDGLNMEELQKEYGSPLVIYFEEEIETNFRALKSSLPDKADIVYSIKANPNPFVIKSLEKMGALFETASEGEFEHLQKIGIEPNKILYSGQAKSELGIEKAILNNVLAINAESERDILLIKKYTNIHRKKVKILIRVNPNLKASDAVLKMGGVASPFGVDEEYLGDVVDLCNDEYISFAGFFMYAGSQYYSADSIVNNTQYLCNLAFDFCTKRNINITYIDFGGGFGVVENENQVPLNMEDLKKGMHDKLKDDFTKLYSLKLEKMFFESGRYLTASSGILLTKVVDIKKSRDKTYVIIDSGINNTGIKQYCYRMYEPFIYILNKEVNKKSNKIIVGPTCTTIDIVHKGIDLPELRPGDTLAVRDCGAYLMSYSPVYFCGHPVPAEVAITREGRKILTRERSSIENACGYGYQYKY
jgi:diaminopimelate decarboxylase